MALYLVQHGKSLPKEVSPERALSEEGIAEVEKIARAVKGYDIRVRQIRHSTKLRAQQTATLFQAALDPQEPMQVMEGLKPLDDVAAVAARILKEPDIMLVGHLPFMERMASYLITGSIEKTVFKFQNGGLVCLDREQGTGNWFIKWALVPNIE
ncbi:MAG: phosphohistidine phosphatase SixA [Deltaproteobacteria bacterium]|nr:phosphohistidine phosphatase SixA [Deltaproteobacteria bacterium]